jgi:transposase
MEVVQCILYRLKTGVQWSNIFVDTEAFKYPFSWQLVYYYYRKWSEAGIFRQMFEMYLFLQQDKLDTENLNLDSTHSYVKNPVNLSAVNVVKRENGQCFI